jgi:serine/threonine protein kinase
MREVKILKALHHVNIVTLKEIVTSNSSKGALLYSISLFFLR